ncbi:hypothetical protein [Christiangramia sabulilitoris]|uniref:Beta-lactamase-inhibitor-like PepSY-like domain-containing protein n=1 Tax=Christiangramia sabulilitoris TaxID=2583991 RepID=A0A550I7I1_9FLAO|nr:hypothetical protein [Christiangramia sabulilitoris]TRO66927.1 hypothetical protein FGM01_03280 [Christiangramia sabulilitoris]
MKTLIFSLLLIAATTFSQAQEIQLEEAKVGFAPLDSKVERNGDEFSFKVAETYTGEFTKDPIAFMKANFDIKNFIAAHDEEWDSYAVTFSSSKGYLSADFDKDGNLVSTFQKFKDIVLPLDVRREVYMANKGWTMTGNKYTASGSGEIIQKEVYKIKLVNGNQKRTMKIDPRASETSVAINE